MRTAVAWRALRVATSCLALGSAGIARQAPQTPFEPPPEWKAVRMDLDVAIAPASASFALDGVLRLRLESESATRLVLGAQSLVQIERLDVPGAAEVELDLPFPPVPEGRIAQARFAEPLARGTELEVRFAAKSRGQANQLVVAEDVALASWVTTWYPAAVDMSASISRMMSATGTTRFHLPHGWDVVSNGRYAGREETDGGAIVTYAVDEPVARSFAAGPYTGVRHEVGGRSVGVYLLSEKAKSARDQVEALAAALAAQEARFGPYPYSSYAIAEIPEWRVGFYASSEQGFIMARSSAFQVDHGNLPLWAHEMAHGWWGNLVGSDGPGGILCSESLAQYSAVLAIEAIEGEDAATEFLRFSRSGYSPRQCARGYFQLWRDGTDMPLSELGGGGWQHDLSDAKGHWVFHMLRQRVGDERFFAVLRGLLRDYAGKELSLDALRAAFEKEAPPEADVVRFFDQWLDRSGAPILELESSPAGAGVAVTIRQVQADEPYHLDVEVALDAGERTELRTIAVRERETRAVLDVPGVTGVRLDPRHRLLIWEPEYGPRP